MADPLLLGAGPQRDVLRQFCAATRSARPVAVLDPAWPTAVQAAARAQVQHAADRGDFVDGDLVVFSSGSTGSPRGVVRTVESWRASCASLSELLRDGVGTVVGVPGPLASSLYLYGAWHAVEAGHKVVLADEWATGAAALNRVSVVHAVPGRVAGWTPPPSLRTLVLGGDGVPPDVRRVCQERGVRLIEYYGSVEASFVLVRETLDDNGFRAFPRVDVRTDQQGRLWSRSPYAFRRYLAGAGPARWADGWLSVGDLAQSGVTGWRLLGRPGTITTGGHTVLAADVEAFLLTLAGVDAALVVAVPDARLGEVVGAVVETRCTVAELRTAVRALPAPARPRRWVTVAQLPRLASGKPDRLGAEGLLRKGRRAADLG